MKQLVAQFRRHALARLNYFEKQWPLLVEVERALLQRLLRLELPLGQSKREAKGKAMLHLL